jgi:hypothetical protein
MCGSSIHYGVDYYGESGGEINHLVATYIIDRAGNVVRVLKGPNHTVAELLREVRKLPPPSSAAVSHANRCGTEAHVSQATWAVSRGRENADRSFTQGGGP